MTNTGQVDQQTREEHSPQHAAAVACVLQNCDPQMDDDGIIFHDERLDLYNTKGNIQRCCDKPVSYTHLTLPTKRIV